MNYPYRLFDRSFCFSPFSFPGQYIGSLIGAVWTTAGVISFALYGLTRLASHPTQAWRVSLDRCLFSK